jgi:hypothetical protein
VRLGTVISTLLGPEGTTMSGRVSAVVVSVRRSRHGLVAHTVRGFRWSAFGSVGVLRGSVWGRWGCGLVVG